MMRLKLSRNWCTLTAMFSLWGTFLVLVWWYGVDVPVGDQWSGSLVFDEVFAGRGTFQTLIQQHNEARPAWPRLIWLGLIALEGRWNSHAEMFVTQAALIATSVGFYVLCQRSFQGWLVTAVWLGSSLLLFSLAQYDNFFWGFQSTAYFPSVSLVLGLVSIGTRHAARWSWPMAVAACCVLGSMGTFSFANGLLVWPLLIVALAVADGVAWRARLGAVLVMAAWAALNAWVYFRDFVNPNPTQDFLGVVKQPWAALQAFLAYCGSALAIEPRRFSVAIVVGAVECVVLVHAVYWLFRHRKDRALVHRALPWGLIAAYGIGSGFIATFGRLFLGKEYLLASRYVALSSLALIATLGLAALRASWRWQHADHAGRLRLTASAVALGTTAAVLFVLNTLDSLNQTRYMQASRLRSQATLRFIEAAEDVDVSNYLFWPGAAFVRDRAPAVRATGLRPLVPTTISWMATTESVGRVERVAAVGNGQWRATGWMYFGLRERVPDALLVTDERASDHRVIRIAVTPTFRPDVNPRTPHTGWEVTFPMADAVPRLAFWVLDVRSGHAYALCLGVGTCGKFDGAINAALDSSPAQ